MKFILGRKLDMTQIFDEDGKVTPVTLIGVEPNVVIQIKTKDKDGYNAVQIGEGNRKHVKKPQKGHYKELGNFMHVREFRLESGELKVGDKLDVESFNPGDAVNISGVTKGKGFEGAVKRHGFSGMPAGHGHHHVLRHIGSIGQRFPQHTLKGKRMAGHAGNAKLTVKGKIIKVDKENGILAVKGAVPGSRGGLIKILAK